MKSGTITPKAGKGSDPADVQVVLDELQRLSSKKVREEMESRYGIVTKKAYGVLMHDLQKVAQRIGTDHEFALALWKMGWYEARMVACMIDDPAQVTAAQMDAWCQDFDNWGICDTVCFKLFDQVPYAQSKVKQWAKRTNEFEKRAAFALLASIALHDRKADEKVFLTCFPLIRAAARDERNFVKKGVSWALRGIAQRSYSLLEAAIELATELAESENTTERWVGKDVLRDIKRPLIAKRAVERDKKK